MKITTLEKHTNEAALAGLTLLGEGKNARFRTYKFNACGHTAEIQTGDVRINNFTCKECLAEKLSQEAEQVGLTLLGAAKINDKNYRTYEFNVCGHTSELQTGNVRNNKFICKDCLVERLNQEAEQVGLTLLGAAKINDKNYRTYEFNSCGHTTEIATGSVRINNFRCNECIAEKLSQEAEQVGLTLLGKGRTAHYHTYKFKSCGHTAEIVTCSVRINNFKCNECIAEKLSQEAELVGLTLLGAAKINDKNYRIYKFNVCGHTSELQTGHVRNNSFKCQQCEETSRTQPSSTYLLKITSGGFTWLKYGYTKSIDNRIKQYGLPADAVVELISQDSYATGNKAHAYEESNHKKLGKNKLCSKMMSKYHTKNGQTECYPLTMLDQLTATFNAK